MSFTGNFTAAQQADNTDVLFTDTSTGADANLTDRRIYPYNAAGALVLPAGNTLGYIDWPLPLATPLTVANLLPKDYALNINVVWISSAPIGGSTYSVTTLYGFTGNTQQFIYQLLQDLSANNLLKNDVQWQANLFSLYNEISNVGTSVTKGDIKLAQDALDRAFAIMQDKANTF